MTYLASSAGARRASDLDRLLAPASLAGMCAGASAALVTMTGHWIAGSGFFTPLYGVMQTLSPQTVINSIAAAQDGNAFYAVRNPLVAGGAVMLTVGGVLGMVYLMIARRLAPRWPVTLGAGVGFALALFALISVSGLSTNSRLVAGSPPMAELSTATGWVILLAEYLTFGLVLGTWAAWRPHDLRPQKALGPGGPAAPTGGAGSADADEGRND